MTAPADRPPPEAFLAAARAEGRGRLKVFLGAAPGVGKTYEMLSDAAALRRDGIDVVIGIVETHGRAETEALVRGFEVLPRSLVAYHGRTLGELDIDALLARRPALALVDEFAHSNAPGARHPKRYQDVAELLAAGIDVFTTLNVQHIESLNDVVASFTKVRVRETVPDRVLEGVDLEVVDILPGELIARLKAGKVYIPEEASRALGSFFSVTNLQALRELALRRAAQAVDTQMLDHLRAHALGGAFAAGERILVAVSELPSAPGLVRAAKRIADASRAPWTALFVETARTAAFTASERDRLAATLALASELGASVATVPALDVVAGVRAYAADLRATQIVIGKSTRSRWFELRHGSVVDRLVRGAGDVAVPVLPAAVEPGAAARGAAAGEARVPAPTATTPGDYPRAAALVALTAGVGVLVEPWVGASSLDLLFLVPVLAAGTRLGLRPALLAGALGALAYNFFFLPPLYTFTIADPRNVITVLVLLGVAALASQLAARVRRQADLASGSARANAALAGFSRHLTAAATEAELAQALSAEVARLFDARVTVLAVRGTGLDIIAATPPEDRLGAVETAAAEWVALHGRAAGRGSDTLPAADWLFHPVRAGGAVRAVLGLARDDGREPVRADALPLLLSLLDQAGLAFDRVRLEGEMGEIVTLKERDRLRATLLASVSHDLRTPLTGVLAAAAALRNGDGDRVAVLDMLEGEARRLERFVNNLLDIARVDAGALRLSVEAVDLTDAVGAAVHDLRAELAGRPIDLRVAPDLPLVRVDARLFHHCLINLLDNAAKYGRSETPITIAAEWSGGELSLKVLDEGDGLPPGSETRVFETFARLDGSDRARGGTGLGLAIVKGFAEAMGLRVSAANRRDPRGACFALTIPPALIVRTAAAAA